MTEPPSRSALRRARRVLVKVGTSVLANEDGRPSLTRIGAIAEQIAELTRDGVEVIFVSSGAVNMGKRVLRKQSRMAMSFNELQSDDEQQFSNNGIPGCSGHSSIARARRSSAGVVGSESFVSLLQLAELPHPGEERSKHYDSACASAGQFEMMSLYCSLFDQCEVAASQILVTQNDFQHQSSVNNLKYAIDRLLSLGIVPIINENDAVSGNTGYTEEHKFSDNDSLAALCARTFGVEVCLLLTDVEGVFDRPPSEEGATKLAVFRQESSVAIGEKSSQGKFDAVIIMIRKCLLMSMPSHLINELNCLCRMFVCLFHKYINTGRGGMQSKIDAALKAVEPGSQCNACIVACGNDLNAIRGVLGRDVFPGPPKGTLFATSNSDLSTQAIAEVEAAAAATGASVSDEARKSATAARDEARKLQALSYGERQAILNAVADALMDRKEELLAANAIDLEAATRDDVALPLVRRLKLTDEKLSTLAAGIRQIAEQPEPLGVVKSKRELADGLELSLITVPIGVLMIIFESRPDSLPQISALALASGNGLLLKGGKEATHSNAALHKVIGDAVEAGSGGKIKRDIIALVTSRGQVADMLSLDDVIDLVIPRGSNALVSYIKANTRIPVLGHADGVCHVYIDPSADADNASKLVVDAKTDYPSACNAMETLLLHEDTLKSGLAMSTLLSLRAAGVKCLGGPRAMKAGLCDIPAKEMKCEYGDLTCMVEVVPNMDEAIDWIHKYGSGHTEAIVCGENSDVGEEFLRRVDAACVFKNASTRFADGYRFGLGAEVGISTGRIHARGPVGVEGLLTTKWQLRSSGLNYVAEYGGDSPTKHYTHKELM